jgi:hypothetical protein
MTKKPDAITPTSTDLVPVSPTEALQRAQALIEDIADVVDDPTPRMAAAILNADDPEDWESIFKGRSIKDSAGAKVRIVALRKAPSQFEGSIPYFLIAEIVNLETGESDVMTISSVMSMLQLVVAHDRGWLPLDVEVVRKTTPTRRGFHPIHLKAITAPKPISAAAS